MNPFEELKNINFSFLVNNQIEKDLNEFLNQNKTVTFKSKCKTFILNFLIEHILVILFLCALFMFLGYRYYEKNKTKEKFYDFDEYKNKPFPRSTMMPSCPLKCQNNYQIDLATQGLDSTYQVPQHYFPKRLANLNCTYRGLVNKQDKQNKQKKYDSQTGDFIIQSQILNQKVMDKYNNIQNNKLK